MKVRLLRLMAGPSGCSHPGQTIDVSVEVAADLVAAGAAVAVERAVARTPENTQAPAAPEAAVIHAPETATARRGGRKPKA